MVTKALSQIPLPLGINGPRHPDGPSARERLEQPAQARLHAKYADRMVVNRDLSRALVSFQGNKTSRFNRWLNYREGFSAELVSYCLEFATTSDGRAARVLDPFAGSGTTLTTARDRGWQATGIELMPVGTAAIEARLLAETVDLDAFQRATRRLGRFDLDRPAAPGYRFQHIRITENAFSSATENALARYRAFADRITDRDVRFLFSFAGLAVLEDISFTRKDGQYLRWDTRSGRALRSDFNKGRILDFRDAVTSKLGGMFADMQFRRGAPATRSSVEIIEGSCLSELPLMAPESFDLVLTSPPYCNRYDYTRTYALELAFFGYGEDRVKALRQTLLSATVENRSKRDALAGVYEALGASARYQTAVECLERETAIREALEYLATARADGKLNNNNIPLLVENYFFEMNLVIHELARVLAPGGQVIMVNDNVRYHGREIAVDLILSHLAEMAGLHLDHIWVLPRGKGNSSQQMGEFGRTELRKCIYVWSKP